MLAAGHIGKQPDQFGFQSLDYHDPLSFETVWVPGATELSMVAKASGVDEDDVAELNPHLIKGRTPSSRGYSVRIPTGTSVAFESNFPALYRSVRLARVEKPAKSASVVATRSHRVRSGETLSHIGRRYGISVSTLRSANGNIDPRRVRAGQTLKIPGGSKVAVASASAKVHRVRAGENLTRIARRYGVTIGQIRSWNGLSGSRIYAGQRLRIRV
jgi:LysM repeat protein